MKRKPGSPSKVVYICDGKACEDGCELSTYKKESTMIKKRYIVDVEYSSADKGAVIVKEVDSGKPFERTVAATYTGNTGLSVVEKLLGEKTTWFEESEVENNEGPQE